MQGANSGRDDGVAREVRGRFDGLVEAVSAMDFDGWASFYSDDAFIGAVAGTDCYTMKFAWTGAVARYFESRRSQSLEIVDVRVHPLASDLAILNSEENSTFEQTDGTVLKARHVFTMVWKKQSQGWKIIHSHESWLEA